MVGPLLSKRGRTSRQIAWARQQRGWKGQPDGGFTGLGTSPVKMMRLRWRLHVRIGDRAGREQRDGVRVLRLAVDIVARPKLHDLPKIHDGDAVADVLDRGQVVGDEHVGQVELVLQIAQQVQHLRLNRDIQRRDRLVGDDEPRIERERARDADALALTAAELVRIAVQDSSGSCPPPGAARAHDRRLFARCRD